jgi:hypothetical protein
MDSPLQEATKVQVGANQSTCRSTVTFGNTCVVASREFNIGAATGGAVDGKWTLFDVETGAVLNSLFCIRLFQGC